MGIREIIGKLEEKTLKGEIAWARSGFTYVAGFEAGKVVIGPWVDDRDGGFAWAELYNRNDVQLDRASVGGRLWKLLSGDLDRQQTTRGILEELG